MEHRTPVIYHATDTTLAKLDKVQKRLLRMISYTEREVLLHCNLAPLETRRDIAMLGLVHRTVLGKEPSHFRSFLRLTSRQPLYQTRLARRRHDNQLETLSCLNCSELLRLSALGLAAVYNMLPEKIIPGCD